MFLQMIVNIENNTVSYVGHSMSDLLEYLAYKVIIGKNEKIVLVAGGNKIFHDELVKILVCGPIGYCSEAKPKYYRICNAKNDVQIYFVKSDNTDIIRGLRADKIILYEPQYMKQQDVDDIIVGTLPVDILSN